MEHELQSARQALISGDTSKENSDLKVELASLSEKLNQETLVSQSLNVKNLIFND